MVALYLCLPQLLAENFMTGSYWLQLNVYTIQELSVKIPDYNSRNLRRPGFEKLTIYLTKRGFG